MLITINIINHKMSFIKILKGKTEYVKKQRPTGLKLRGKKMQPQLQSELNVS